MSEYTQGGGRRAFGDLTNVLGKRPAPIDLVKNAGGIKIGRIEKAVQPRKEFDENAKAGGGNMSGHSFDDGVSKENIVRPSIFHGTKVQHMAAEAAGILSKEASARRSRCVSLDSSGFVDKEDSSLESEGACEEEDDDDTDSEMLAYTRESSKTASSDRVNDGECLTQEELVRSSGNQKPLSSLDFTTGDDVPCSNDQHPPLGIGLEETGATSSCACSFCLKAAFMWTDLHYQDARGCLAALKKSIKFARSLDTKSQGNEYVVNTGRHNSNRASDMMFELSQQQRSLFSHTQNALVRESAQLHSSLLKLKDLRESCKTDLEMSSNCLFKK